MAVMYERFKIDKKFDFSCTVEEAVSFFHLLTVDDSSTY